MGFRELQLLVESNALSIQALGDRISELTHIQEEATTERQKLRDVTLDIANLLTSLDSDTQSS